MAAGDIQDGSPAQEGRHGGMGGEGPTDSRPTDGPEDQGHDDRFSMGTQGRVGIGRTNPHFLIRTGGSLCSRGEVLPLGLSRFPVGTNRGWWKRGGLPGLFPGALCGEAPKGQPEICGGNIEAVCVEAPKGQTMSHRRNTRQQLFKGPSGKEPEERGKQQSL